jgi:hypothetical protein
MDLYQGLVLGLLAVSLLVLAGIFTRLGRIRRSLEASTVQPVAAPRSEVEREPAAVVADTVAAADTSAHAAASEPEPVSDREWELVPVAVQETEPEKDEPVAAQEPEAEREAEPVAAQEGEHAAEPVVVEEHEAEPVSAREPEPEREAEPVATEEPEPVAAQEAEHEAEPVDTEEPEPDVAQEAEPVAAREAEHEAEPVAAQEVEHEAGQVDTEEPEEKPFRRDGRWWFRRDDELLVYDDASGEWLPSDAGPREASFVIARDPAPAASVEPGSDLSRETASVATKERDPVSENAGQVFPEGEATEQLAASSFWKCATCGAVNGSTSSTCRMCFAARP